MFRPYDCEAAAYTELKALLPTFFPPGDFCSFVTNAPGILINGANAVTIVNTLNAAAGTGPTQIGVPAITTGNVGTAVTTFIANNNAALALVPLNFAAGTASGQTGYSGTISNALTGGAATLAFIANNDKALALNTINAAQGTGPTQTGFSSTITSSNAASAVSTFVTNNNAFLALGVLNAAQGTAPGQTGTTVTIADTTTATTAKNDFIATNNLALAVELLNTLAGPPTPLAAGLTITNPNGPVPTGPTLVPALTHPWTDAQVKAAVNGMIPPLGSGFLPVPPSSDTLKTILVLEFIQVACAPLYASPSDPLVDLCHVLCASGANFGGAWVDCATT